MLRRKRRRTHTARVTDPPRRCNHHRRYLRKRMVLHEHETSSKSEPCAWRKGGASKLLSIHPITTIPFSGPSFYNRLICRKRMALKFVFVFRVGEYRMRQTVENPRLRGGAPSGSRTGTSSGYVTAHQTIEPPTLPLHAPNRDPSGDRSQHGTLTPGEEAMRSESSANVQPVPQSERDRGGLPYTQRVSRRTCPMRPILI